MLDAALLRLEESGDLADEQRTSLLRALHTLKGNSGMLGLHPVVNAVHAVETVLKPADARLSRETIDALFEYAAALRGVAERVGTESQDEAVARLGRLSLPHSAGEPDEGRSERARRPERPTDDAGPAALDEGGAGELLRVPFQKLDTLLNRVGETLIVHSALEELLERFERELDELGARRLFESQVEALRLITDGLREATMDLRLVTVARLFERFPSLARGLARAEGKQVRVVLEGETAEMDKSTVDALADPLLHLVRNAVDHGIATPEERRAQGKPEAGTIVLRARRRGDRVLVEVSDDGSGLDRARILERAVSEGIVAPHERLTDAEIDELIFRPGFTTREEATTVSGRGVGLDVVQRRIRSLRGTLTVGPSPEGGTRFVLALPLTLAIVPALIFESGGEMLALPAMEVEETLRRVRPERAGDAEVVRHQERLIPIARPDRLLGWREGEAEAPAGGSFAIVLRRGNRSAAVLADRLLEQRDVVVKALPRSLGTVRGVSGATVTPAGRVVLLLDPGGLLDMNLHLYRRENRA